MDTPPNASDNDERDNERDNESSGPSPNQPPNRSSSGPAPDSPFNTSPSEGFEGPFPPSGAQPGAQPGGPAGSGGPAGAPAGSSPFGTPPMSVSDDWSTVTIPASIAVDMARDWVRERQTATLLGAFAAGVFVGVLSR